MGCLLPGSLFLWLYLIMRSFYLYCTRSKNRFAKVLDKSGIDFVAIPVNNRIMNW